MATYPRINKIKLSNYRNHKKLTIECKKNFIFLKGKNGAGKTNILEAISLLSTRTGFRGSQLHAILNKNCLKLEEFGVHFNLILNGVELDVGIGLKRKNDILHRITKVDGFNKKINIDEIIKIFWILPTMNSLFVGPSKPRRIFYDHMISYLIDGHNKMIKDYENLQQQRIKILKFYSLSPQNLRWLELIEKKMSTTGILITENRINFLNSLNELMLLEKRNYFPSLKVNISDGMSEKYNQNSALKVEEDFANLLNKFRDIDKKTGKTSISAINSDFTILNQDKMMKDRECSTGEQKIILVSLLIYFIKLLTTNGEKNIIFLLDDIFSTLDSKFIEILLSALNDLKIQTWITDIDSSVINRDHKIYKNTMFINIEDINI